MKDGREIVRMENITKTFPGVKALSGVHLDIRAGECHALVGENGAGKSTLIKILMGAYAKDSGTILLDGRAVEIKDAIHAKSLGMGAVYQDIMLAQHLSVAENFFLGQLPRNRLGLVDWNQANRQTEDALERLGIGVDVRSKIMDISTAQQEMVAIAKAVHEKARIMVFDEPTALLTTDETRILFKLIDQLKKNGIGIIYISHRMEEIFEICDRVTILKDGQYVGTTDVADTNERKLVRMMVGRGVDDMYNINLPVPGEALCRVENFTLGGRFRNINFEVRRGEILGFFGLVGSGRTEIMRCLFGADHRSSGTVFICGRQVDIVSPRMGIANRIAFLSENRKYDGLAMQLSVKENVNLANYKAVSTLGMIHQGAEVATADRFIKQINIKTPTPMQKAKNLSGGNQQKVVIAKWLCCDSDLFIFDEPTVGVDVGAKVEIYRLFENLLRQGRAVIVVSSYLPEIMGLSHRLVIISEGRQMGILEREQFMPEGEKPNEELVLRMASGIVV